MVFLIDPYQETLFVVVEDTTAVGPVAVQTAGLKEAVTLPTQSQKIRETYLKRK